jgi:hypothetical protein
MNYAAAALSFLLTVAFVPGHVGAALPTGWVVLSLCLPFFLLGKVPLIPPMWWGLAFLCYAFAFAPWTSDSIYGLWQLAILAAAFALGLRLETLRHVFIGLSAGVAVSAVVAGAQWLGYSPVGGVEGHVSGLFFNKNILAETALVVLVGALCFKLYYLAVGPATALILSYNRAALAAAGVVLLAYILPGRPVIYAAALLIGATVLAFFGVSSSLQRLELWSDAIQHTTLLGLGPNSFYPSRASHVHNDYLELIYEYGIGSVFLATCLYLSVESSHAARPVLLVVGTIALFSFPLHYPVTAFVATVVAGHLARARYLVWADSADSGSALHPRMGYARPRRFAVRRPSLSLQPNHPARAG